MEPLRAPPLAGCASFGQARALAGAPDRLLRAQLSAQATSLEGVGRPAARSQPPRLWGWLSRACGLALAAGAAKRRGALPRTSLLAKAKEEDPWREGERDRKRWLRRERLQQLGQVKAAKRYTEDLDELDQQDIDDPLNKKMDGSQWDSWDIDAYDDSERELADKINKKKKEKAAARRLKERQKYTPEQVAAIRQGYALKGAADAYAAMERQMKGAQRKDLDKLSGILTGKAADEAAVKAKMAAESWAKRIIQDRTRRMEAQEKEQLARATYRAGNTVTAAPEGPIARKIAHVKQFGGHERNYN